MKQYVDLVINTDIDGYSIDDFEIADYEHCPFVKLPIAV
jgi:thymidylate synthase